MKRRKGYQLAADTRLITRRVSVPVRAAFNYIHTWQYTPLWHRAWDQNIWKLVDKKEDEPQFFPVSTIDQVQQPQATRPKSPRLKGIIPNTNSVSNRNESLFDGTHAMKNFVQKTVID